jgi:two-component system response regulator MprA
MQERQRSSALGDILVVDDDPIIVEMLSDLLAFEGYAVRGAGNGLEAMETILADRPALVLLDLQMPYMSGAELLDALSRSVFADLPVIIITASPLEAQRVALDTNVACMTKPLDLDALLAGIAAALRVDE